jgi:hypothetical protein
MPQREFANQKALVAYAERNGLVYLWEGTPAFAKRQRLLSPDQYDLVEVRTRRRGVRPLMLFPKAVLEVEWATDAPFREAIAIKRERLRALRAKRAAKYGDPIRECQGRDDSANHTPRKRVGDGVAEFDWRRRHSPASL